MRILDAHAHVFPRGFAGKFDARSGVTVLPRGKVRKRDGEEVPIMPEKYADTGFPPEELLGMMDASGVSRAVLLANSITDLEESARAVREYPGRGGKFIKVFTLISLAFFALVALPGYFISKNGMG